MITMSQDAKIHYQFREKLSNKETSDCIENKTIGNHCYHCHTSGHNNPTCYFSDDPIDWNPSDQYRIKLWQYIESLPELGIRTYYPAIQDKKQYIIDEMNRILLGSKILVIYFLY